MYTDQNGNQPFYDNQTDNYIQTHYQLYLVQEINRNWNLNVSGHYTRGKGYYEEYKEGQSFSSYNLPDIIIGTDTITSTNLVRQRWLDNHFGGATFAVNHDNKRRLRLNFGGSYNYYDGDHFGEIIWAQWAANQDKNYRWYDNTGIKTDLNFFAKIQYQLSEKVNLYGDVQYRNINYRINGIDNDLRDISQKHIYNFFNPKAGVFIDINQQNQVFVSMAIANREPNRSALIDANPARPYPVHETLYDLEAGYKFASKRVSLQANLYYMYYNNQLVLTGKINDVGDPVMENVKNSYRTGLELVLGASLCRKLDWNVNVAFSSNKIRNFISYTDNWNDYPNQIVDSLGTTDIAFSPNIVANSNFYFEPVKNLHLVLISKFVGKQFIDNTSSEERKLDPYFINDFMISYAFHPKFMKEIVLSLKVNNFMNTKYESNAWIYRYYYDGEYGVYDGYFPQATINFMAGLSLRF